MYQYLYVSSAAELLSDAQLDELLETSRAHNEASGVTGLLLYVRGSFIQLLEGDREAVATTCARIAADPRHRGMITLLEGDCAQRDFPTWTMGFPRVDEARLPGYSDFLRQAADPAATQSAARKLLEFFKELNGRRA